MTTTTCAGHWGGCCARSATTYICLNPPRSSRRRPSRPIAHRRRAAARLSGLELRERLRSRAAPIPVVLITGDPDPGRDPVRAIDIPSITKPFDDNILMAAIADAMSAEGFGVSAMHTDDRYRRAAAAGGVGIWDWDLATSEIYVDPILKEMLGYEDHEIRNHLDDWARLVHPDDAAAVLERAQAHIAGETPLYEVEHRMLHRDGSIRWFLARGSVDQRRRRVAPFRGRDRHRHHRAQARRRGAAPGRGAQQAHRREHRRLREDPRPRRPPDLHQPRRPAPARVPDASRICCTGRWSTSSAGEMREAPEDAIARRGAAVRGRFQGRCRRRPAS